MDLPPFLTQPVKTQNPMNGELSHGIVTQAVHQGVQAGRCTAAGSGRFTSRSGTWVGSQPQRVGSLAARVPSGARERISRQWAQQVLQTSKRKIRPSGQAQIASEDSSAELPQVLRECSHRAQPGTEGLLQQKAHEKVGHEQEHGRRMDGRYTPGQQQVFGVHQAGDG